MLTNHVYLSQERFSILNFPFSFNVLFHLFIVFEHILFSGFVLLGLFRGTTCSFLTKRNQQLGEWSSSTFNSKVETIKYM